MAGEIKRVDYSCDRSEALTQINRLVAAFPEYTVEGLTSNSQNVIGEYGNYRPLTPTTALAFMTFRHPAQKPFPPTDALPIHMETICSSGMASNTILPLAQSKPSLCLVKTTAHT